MIILLCGAVATLAYLSVLFYMYTKATRIVRGKDAAIATLTERLDLLCVTCDRARPYPSMTVFAIGPSGSIETLYVEDSLVVASTVFPSSDLADLGAEAVIYPINQCFANRDLADILAHARRAQYDTEDYDDGEN